MPSTSWCYYPYMDEKWLSLLNWSRGIIFFFFLPESWTSSFLLSWWLNSTIPCSFPSFLLWFLPFSSFFPLFLFSFLYPFLSSFISYLIFLSSFLPIIFLPYFLFPFLTTCHLHSFPSFLLASLPSFLYNSLCSFLPSLLSFFLVSFSFPPLFFPNSFSIFLFQIVLSWSDFDFNYFFFLLKKYFPFCTAFAIPIHYDSLFFHSKFLIGNFFSFWNEKTGQKALQFFSLIF